MEGCVGCSHGISYSGESGEPRKWSWGKQAWESLGTSVPAPVPGDETYLP